VKNYDLYTTNQDIHGINTGYNINLLLSMANLTAFQKGACFFGIKLLNHFQKHKNLFNKIKIILTCFKEISSFTFFLLNRMVF
jgi:hypothetical protein